MLSKYELPEMLRAINEYGVTYLPLMPPILVAMVAHPKPLARCRSASCARCSLAGRC